jgi:hypothetical protein
VQGAVLGKKVAHYMRKHYFQAQAPTGQRAVQAATGQRAVQEPTGQRAAALKKCKKKHSKKARKRCRKNGKEASGLRLRF